MAADYENDYNNHLEGRRKNVPQQCVVFPKTRYYMRQIFLNPNRAVKNVLHKTCCLPNPAYKETNIDALKSKANKKTGFSNKVRYKKDIFLAQGAYGKVYLGRYLMKDKDGYSSKQACALKVLNTSHDKDSVIREKKLLQKLQGHAFILQYKFSEYQGKKLIIGTEYCANKDLSDVLANSRELPEHRNGNDTCPRFECKMVRFVMAPIFDAIAYMNRKGYVHRDVKPQNILVDGMGVPKLCDFGQAIKLEKSGVNEADDAAVGSSYYMSPEAAIQADYGPPIDTWSMGISMLVLAYGWGPYHFRTSDIAFHPQHGMPRNTIVVVTAFKHWYREGAAADSVNKSIRQMLKISKRSSLDSENEEDWKAFRRFVGALMIFSPFERPNCYSAAQNEYIREPLIEWKAHNFNKFKTDWEEWQAILEAAN